MAHRITEPKQKRLRIFRIPTGGSYAWYCPRCRETSDRTWAYRKNAVEDLHHHNNQGCNYDYGAQP